MGITDLLGKKQEDAVVFFKQHLNEYADKYNQNALIKKIVEFSKRAGISLIYQVLLIYHGLLNDEVPTSYKLLAIAALGYFISPFDLVPDIIPGGMLDDGSIIAFALAPMYTSLNQQTKADAKRQLHEWFGDYDEADLPVL